MVDIRFPVPHGNAGRVKIAGHSGSGPRGFDLVCSAVSSLVLTMLGGLETEMGAEITGSHESGLCDVTVTVPKDRGGDLETVLRVFRYGFKRLAKAYPEFVKFHS